MEVGLDPRQLPSARVWFRPSTQLGIALGMIAVIAVLLGVAAYFGRARHAPKDRKSGPLPLRVERSRAPPLGALVGSGSACLNAEDDREVVGSASLGGFWAALRGSWTDGTATMTLHYGTIPTSAGTSAQTGQLNLASMVVPTARLTSASYQFQRFPHVKPVLLKMYQDRSGGTNADPEYTVHVVAVGKHASTDSLVAFTADLGDYSVTEAGTLDF